MSITILTKIVIAAGAMFVIAYTAADMALSHHRPSLLAEAGAGAAQ